MALSMDELMESTMERPKGTSHARSMAYSVDEPMGYITIDHGVRHRSPHGLTHGRCHGSPPLNTLRHAPWHAPWNTPWFER